MSGERSAVRPVGRIGEHCSVRPGLLMATAVQIEWSNPRVQLDRRGHGTGSQQWKLSFVHSSAGLGWRAEDRTSMSAKADPIEKCSRKGPSMRSAVELGSDGTVEPRRCRYAVLSATAMDITASMKALSETAGCVRAAARIHWHTNSPTGPEALQAQRVVAVATGETFRNQAPDCSEPRPRIGRGC